MSILAPLLVLILVAFAIIWRACVGDRRAHFRRCPQCWYDMCATSGTQCPECGHTPKHAYQLHKNRRWKNTLRVSVPSLVLLVLAFTFFAIPGPWTSNVPHPLMRLMLRVAAPAPNTPGTSNPLPTPNAAFDKWSSSHWHRMVWHYQANATYNAWAQAVLATDGPITPAEFARLVPLASQAHAIFVESGYSYNNEAWQNDDTTGRLASQREASRDNPDLLLRYDWILSELQYSDADYSRNPGFALFPDSLIALALDHPSAAVRAFGIDRFGHRVHQRVITPSMPMPAGGDTIAAMASTDPDPKTAALARQIRDYVNAFFPKP